MTQQLILNESQAKAIYDAMCALNNVGARVTAELPEDIQAYELGDGSICVQNDARMVFEAHDNQAAFAAAYGLVLWGEPQSDVAAAAGGLTQTAIER